MRGLTLRQPYAAALALGLKRFETRSWSTTYRGSVAIHAACGDPWLCEEVIADPLVHVRGAILGVGQLADVYSTETLHADERETRPGDYASGRYMWEFSDVVRFQQPVPCRGHLGLWRLLPATQAVLLARLRIEGYTCWAG